MQSCGVLDIVHVHIYTAGNDCADARSPCRGAPCTAVLLTRAEKHTANAAAYASVVAMYLPWRRAHYVTTVARPATMRTMIEAHALIDNRTMIEKNPATNRQSLEHPATPHQRLHAMIAVRQPRSECWSWRAPPVPAQPISSLLPSHGVAIDANPQYLGGTCQVDRGTILLDL